MDDKYLTILEYFKILDQLAEHASFSAGTELALSLRPSADPASVQRSIQETTEAKALLSTQPQLGPRGAHDLRPLVKRAALGGVLLPRELLAVSATLIGARTLRQALVRRADECPLLAARARGLRTLPGLVEEIARCLDDEGRVLDSASTTLARLRRDSRTARERVMRLLRRIITSGENARFLQELIVTERNLRYVIPLKAEFKGRIPGIIHDQSASGATLFIEPLATIELNNQWHQLQLEEQREIERILTELSGLVASEAEALIHDVVVLAELDLALAKARYSFELRGVPAALFGNRWPVAGRGAELEASQHPLNLIRARHPLLPRETVVPIDVYAGGDNTILLVTGPNTGGKTVSLKTVGLLAAMSQAGMHIPASDGSHLPVFTGIYADIGDEQSIEQSLSTFSSHMGHIIDILHRADSASLVLLDEMGAGTDPVEGAALAQALIGQLIKQGCLVMGATHHPQLKLFAFNTPGVQNASVDFDAETLSPTYHLTIGPPGRSNAFAIARRLGLAEEIIERAQSLVSPDDLQADALLGSIREANEAASTARRDAEESLARVQEMEGELRVKLANIDETRRQISDRAREEGRQELEKLRAEIEHLRGDLARGGSTRESLQEAERTIDRLYERVVPLPPIFEPSPPPTGNLKADGLKVGDMVYIEDLGQTAELLSISGTDAELLAGGFRLRTRLSNLEFRSRPEEAEPSQPRPVLPPRVESPGIELHIRGLRAEEVAPRLERYLDTAYLAGLPWVHIVHGKGLGVLKEVVRDLLKDHPLVDSFRPGELAEGGDGVTVVHLQVYSG
ncbi:MAG TPA: endonuclease MutS2 [Anaerolineae bacterium]|nr:endonuclease MutS2 [Anaerolineae bacterium]